MVVSRLVGVVSAAVLRKRFSLPGLEQGALTRTYMSMSVIM